MSLDVRESSRKSLQKSTFQSQAFASKRTPAIDEVEKIVVKEMRELEEAVRAYNIDVQMKLNTIRKHIASVDKQTNEHGETMESETERLQSHIEKSFQDAFVFLEQKMLSTFAHMDMNQVTPLEKKLRTCESSFQEFASIPDALEKAQGTVTQRLQSSRDAFDLEQSKILKREQKTQSMLEQKNQRTRKTFEIERKFRGQKFRHHNETFHHVMKSDNRSSARQQGNHIASTFEVWKQLEKCSAVRAKEDAIILSNVTDSFQKLQTSVQEHFGAQSDTTVA